MDTGTNRLITKLEEYANPAIQSIIAELRGTDGYAELDTGETIDEWYGMRVNPRVRMWLTTVLPQLETVNRLLPESVVGRAPDYNIDTGQYTGGTRSVFGVPRSGRNRDTNNPYSGARAVGVNIHAIDVYRELGLTYDTLAIDILEGRKFLQKMKENLSMLEPGSAVYQQRLAEVRQVEYILEQSERDYRRIEEFARSQGLNPRTLYHRMQQRNTTMNEIP